LPLRDDGNYRYPDDDVFLIVRGENACLMQFDMSIHGTTTQPQKLIKNDGG
jgi:hypothetical protein